MNGTKSRKRTSDLNLLIYSSIGFNLMNLERKYFKFMIIYGNMACSQAKQSKTKTKNRSIRYHNSNDVNSIKVLSATESMTISLMHFYQSIISAFSINITSLACIKCSLSINTRQLRNCTAGPRQGKKQC